MFVAWIHPAGGASRAVVPPDGCRDVLLIRSPGAAPRLRVTPLDARLRRVAVASGVAITGYRFQPGIDIDPRALAGAEPDPEALPDRLREAARFDREALAAVELLAAPDGSLRGAAGLLGVSPRSVQRRLRAIGLPPPVFWRRLGRARRAALALGGDAPLVDIAYAMGYSDQAHMTRELREIFCAAPMALRRDAALLALIAQPGLGGWTGEQISTR